MARAISMRHTVATAGDKKEFRERAKASRTHYTKAGCQYWLFEEAGLPGAYVEFFEGPDRESLLRAHQTAPKPVMESARMYVEVDLS